jgi:hypothetical protein
MANRTDKFAKSIHGTNPQVRLVPVQRAQAPRLNVITPATTAAAEACQIRGASTTIRHRGRAEPVFHAFFHSALKPHSLSNSACSGTPGGSTTRSTAAPPLARWSPPSIHTTSPPPTQPQNLVEKITRNKIQASVYWKEKCFGLSAETLIDRAVELRSVGGMYGEPNKPTEFVCLILKMLQIQPDFDIVVELIRNEDYKYVRLLGERPVIPILICDLHTARNRRAPVQAYPYRAHRIQRPQLVPVLCVVFSQPATPFLDSL